MSFRRVLCKTKFRSVYERGNGQRHSGSVVNSQPELVQSFPEHSKRGNCVPWFHKGHNQLLGNFLKEQRQLFNDLVSHLKDQRMLLNSIEEDLALRNGSEVDKEMINDTMRLSEDFGSYFSECKSMKGAGENGRCMISDTGDNMSVAEEPHGDSEQESTTASQSSAGYEPSTVGSEEETKHSGPMAINDTGVNKFHHPSWPEWTTFLSRLRPFVCSKESKEDLKLFEDTTILKRAIVKFAQAHEGSFGSLSQKHLCVLVKHKFPSMDEKTAAGKKKLEMYLRAGSSEMEKVWSNKVVRAKLTDVVRVLYRAVRSMPALGGALPSNLSSSIVSILQELNTASAVQLYDPVPISKDIFIDMGQIVQGSVQETQQVNPDEGQGCSDVCNAMEGDEAVESDKTASLEQSDWTMKTSSRVDFPDLARFGSLKERVDARKERLAREAVVKEAVKSQLAQDPVLAAGFVQNMMIKGNSVHEKTKDLGIAAKNFERLDAIIESDDIDDGMTPIRLQSPGSEIRSEVPKIARYMKGC